MGLKKILNIKVKQLPKKYRFVTAFLCAMYIYLFFLIFTPFDTFELVYKNHLKFIGIPIIVFIVMIFFLNIPIKLIPNFFNKDNWKIKKQSVFIFTIFVVVAIFVFFYNYFFLQLINEKFKFIHYLLFTISIGIIPTLLYISAIIIFFDENSISGIPKTKNSVLNDSQLFVFKSVDKKVADLIIQKEDFLFIKSENNYCKIVYLKNNQLTSKLLRLTLKNAEKQLESFDDLLRCHRSYSINKTKIIKIDGNSKSAFIYLNGYNFGIPVSRSNFKSIKNNITG